MSVIVRRSEMHKLLQNATVRILVSSAFLEFHKYHKPFYSNCLGIEFSYSDKLACYLPFLQFQDSWELRTHPPFARFPKFLLKAVLARGGKNASGRRSSFTPIKLPTRATHRIEEETHL